MSSRSLVVTIDDEFGATAPATAADAVSRLDAGSARFAALAGQDTGELRLGPASIGIPRDAGILPQEPFAAALGCSDARVPLEQVLGCAVNDVFVARVAGNVPGSDVLGSLHYAMANLPTIRAVAVVGHSGCGAVTAAVDALLSPATYLRVIRDPALRGIVDAVLAAVHLAANALAGVLGRDVVDSSGYRAALIDLAVLANAAVSARALAADLDREVVFGVYDLGRRQVGAATRDGWRAGLRPAPDDEPALRALLADAAASTAPLLAGPAD